MLTSSQGDRVIVTGVVRRTLAVFGCLVWCLAGAGCGDAPVAPTPVPFSQADLSVGTGTAAAAGKVITVNYTGWLYDATKPDLKGLQFDSSAGTTPFSFTLGIGQVIAGWDQGLPGMKVGGARRLVIPSSLAYGSVRNGPVPPFATLVFEVELLDVQ
jgi:FKBP-type peptidyl-prolyl cis-trans isomerase FkpA